MDADSNRPSENLSTFYRKIDFQLADERLVGMYDSILKSSYVDLEYASLLGLAGLIALFGLLQNSAAVIIGAMLISPLMNPILSGGLAFLLGDGSLGRRSAAVLAISIAGVIAITWFVAWASPLKEVTPEILSRTNPNLLDLFIAVLSGLAGTLALRSGSATLTILPGVAIAVAVVPPLAVVGYGLSIHRGTIAGGAFLLFITNLVAIMISAAIVFRLMGFKPHQQDDQNTFKLKYRMAISAVVLIVLSIPLFQTLRNAVIQVQRRSAISTVLNRTFRTDDSAISELTFVKEKDTLLIRGTVRTAKYFDAPAVQAVEEALKNRFGPNTRLQIDQILMAQGAMSAEQAARIKNFISGGVVQPVKEEAPFDLKSVREKLVAYFQKRVEETLAGTPLHTQGELQLGVENGPAVSLNLHLVAPEPVENQTLSVLASQISSRVSSPVQLHGEAALQGPAFALSLELNHLQTRLVVEDRRKIGDLIKTILQRPDLRLEVRYSSGPQNQPLEPLPVALKEIHDLIARSRLKADQWNFQPETLEVASKATTPPALGGLSSVANAAGAGSYPPVVRCELRAIQTF